MSSLHHQSIIKGIIFVVIGELLIAASAAIVKYISNDALPLEVIVFFRNLFALLLLALAVSHHGFRILNTSVFTTHLIRAGVGLVGMYCFFYSLKEISLAQCMTLFMTTPFFIPIIAAIWLKESVKKSTLAAIFIGFIGVVLIMEPGRDVSPVMLVALTAGFLAGVAKVCLRKLGTTEHPVTIVFYFALLSTALSLFPALKAWQTPDASQYLWLFALGFSATGGQLMITQGFGHAPANIIGPIGFVSILYSTLFGWFFWEEALNQHFVLGALLIVSAGIAIIRFSSKPVAADPEI